MNLEETIGKITTIDPVKGTLVVDSWDGKFMSTHPFHIMPELDVVLRKQKPGYFVQVTHDGELARGIKFANKPDNWPQGKGNFKPRNEKLIVVQVLVKAYTDLCLRSFNPENMDFDIARKLVLDAVEQDIDRVMKIGGEGK